MDVDRGEMPASRARVRGDEAIGIGTRPRRRSEHPLRQAELRVGRWIPHERLDRLAAHAIQLPPAIRIADEVQRAVGRPPGLVDRLRVAAGDMPRVRERALRRDVGDPELGPVPRHLRMAPRDPHGAIRPTEAQLERSVARRDHLPAWIAGDGSARALTFSSTRVVFAHGDHLRRPAIDRDGIEYRLRLEPPSSRAMRYTLCR